MKTTKVWSKASGTKTMLKLGMTALMLSLFVTQNAFTAPKKAYKVSKVNEIVVGAEKIADPSAVKFAVIGPIVEERVMTAKAINQLPGGGIYAGFITSSRTAYLNLADAKVKDFAAAFSAEFAKRYGSAPAAITSNTRKLDNSKPAAVGAADISKDGKFISELAELSKKAAAQQFIVLYTGVEVLDVNMFSGRSGTIGLYLYAVVFGNDGKQVRKIRINGVTAQKVSPEDSEAYAALIDTAKEAIPEIMDKLFAAK
ncbi:MAG: hypothetical protein Ta2A_06030 [Treponemataceae bacterium]|nr:MAG: hypothetical protein Ta2A_06030 [Treponemataceae bacterium]